MEFEEFNRMMNGGSSKEREEKFDAEVTEALANFMKEPLFSLGISMTSKAGTPEREAVIMLLQTTFRCGAKFGVHSFMMHIIKGLDRIMSLRATESGIPKSEIN